jgi:hypothetical protein
MPLLNTQLPTKEIVELFTSLRSGVLTEVEAIYKKFGPAVFHYIESASNSLPLQIALVGGHLTIAQLIIDSDARVLSLPDKVLGTPLNIAVKNGYEAIVSQLLVKIPSEKLTRKTLECALKLANENAHPGVADLISKKLDSLYPKVSTPDKSLEGPARFSVSHVQRIGQRPRGQYFDSSHASSPVAETPSALLPDGVAQPSNPLLGGVEVSSSAFTQRIGRSSPLPPFPTK